MLFSGDMSAGGSRCKVAFRKRAEQKTSDDDVS